MILPGATLGLVGGGQLGRMFTVAARNMGYRVTVLDPDALSPAAEFATGHLNTAYNHPISMEEMAATCAAVTTEFENAPADVLLHLAQHTIVRPGGQAVAIAQNRLLEKEFFARLGLAVGPYAAVTGGDELDSALETVRLPAILKTARFGYDGKGQVRIESRHDLETALSQWPGIACILEQRIELEKEISVVLARSAAGAVAVFPVAENQHVNGILDTTIAPARVDAHLAQTAIQWASRLAEALNYVGVMAVEFFATRSGELLVNEMAPRPHNSGHFTIDACQTSQFEQQVRVLCDLPLGDPSPHSAAVMINLLGDLWRGDDGQQPPGWRSVLQHPEAHLHLYGKRSARPGRKMGHVTVCGANVETALATAKAIRQALMIG